MARAFTSSISFWHILGRPSKISLGALGDIPFLGGLSRISFRALGDIPFLGRLGRINLGALRDISKGNALKGLNKDGWLLGTRDLSTDRRLSSLLRHLGIQTSRCFCRIMRLSSFSRLARNDDDLSSF